MQLTPEQRWRVELELERFIQERLQREQLITIYDEDGNVCEWEGCFDAFDPAIETLARDIVRDFICKEHR